MTALKTIRPGNRVRLSPAGKLAVRKSPYWNTRGKRPSDVGGVGRVRILCGGWAIVKFPNIPEGGWKPEFLERAP